ncbi:MAG: right-handed parallel beta-helix repeat-containing protein [Patescibacteria group bacterium]
MKIIKLTTFILLAFGIFFLFSPPTLAENIGNPLPLPGHIQGTGTFFKITDSEYLNVSLKSSEEITVLLESAPKTISLIIGASSISDSITLIISNLELNKNYYKYEDSYKNETVVVSDENGNYTWTQGLTRSHHIWFQEEGGTIFIPDDCSDYGIWNPSISTCTLTQDLIESIEITTDNIVFDCNGHTISAVSSHGIYINDKEDIAIKNCIVTNSFYGLHLIYSSQNTITNNMLSNNQGPGLNIAYSSYNEITNNIINLNTWYGIRMIGAQDNLIKNNLISSNNYEGIDIDKSALTPSGEIEVSRNTIIENTITSNGGGGIAVHYCLDNYIYHNNFINNQLIWFGSQNYQYPPAFWDNDYPDGGNYWSDYLGVDQFSGPNQDQSGSDGIGDAPTLFSYYSRDRYPFMNENGWEAIINQPPILSNLNQYKFDSITVIEEGWTATESTVIFKAIATDPDNDRVKFQVELKEYGQDFNEQDILQSDFVDSDSEAVVTRYGLVNGKYHWRARAVDFRGAISDWQEFGEVGNVDFEVKLVPLYTQVISPYPSLGETDGWDHLPYAYATADKPYSSCGWRISDCGCAITSMVMLGRYYDIDMGVNNSNTDPANINFWLTSNNGYTKDGRLYWGKGIEYLGFIEDGVKKARLSFDYYNEPSGSFRIDNYINSAKPVIAYSNKFGHYFVVDNKLAATYGLKDPVWYNTKTLNDTEDLVNKIRGYNNYFDKANLFSYLETPKPITASLYFYLASPAELLITDPLGRKLGKDSINNIIYNEIPDGSYTTEGLIITSEIPLTEIHEIKAIYIPMPLEGKYDIQVIGIATGTYTIELLTYDQNGQSKEVILEGNTVTDSIQEFELNYSKKTIQETEIYRIIDIDIKPDNYPNSINLKSKGVTPVAVLSDKFFDAKNVAIESIVFAGAKPLRGNFEDVDNDGDLDLILHFKTQSLKLSSTDTEAVLVGRLVDGSLIKIKGIDSIRIVGK